MVQGDRMDDIRDRDPHRKSGSSLFLDHFRSAAPRFLFHFGNQLRIDPRIFFQRQTGNLSGRPDRHHAVAMLTINRHIDLCRRDIKPLGQHATQSGRIQHGPQADHLRSGKSQLFDGEIGQYIDRIRDDENDGIFPQTTRF